MPTDDLARTSNTKFLVNRRAELAGAHLNQSDHYSRRLSQYGENAVEPAVSGVWQLDINLI